ncbi:MAG: zinc ribbon domain-containing protein, partial [Chloroflexota bacterium]|nr:zinc ribbon domain-containing protein [Chloroflexota bacterium]
MPIYAYHCDDCKEPFELFVRSVSAPVQAVCPKCGSAHTEKEVTA